MLPRAGVGLLQFLLVGLFLDQYTHGFTDLRRGDLPANLELDGHGAFTAILFLLVGQLAFHRAGLGSVLL